MNVEVLPPTTPSYKVTLTAEEAEALARILGSLAPSDVERATLCSEPVAHSVVHMFSELPEVNISSDDYLDAPPFKLWGSMGH